MKQTYYFSHDYHARQDPKLAFLLEKHGVAGIGIYWCIIEMLFEEGGYLPVNSSERIAYELRTQVDVVKSVISDFKLFKMSSSGVTSRSVLKRLQLRKSKSKKAKGSAKVRWKKHYANAKQLECDCNAINESKVNESKVNEIYIKNESPTPSQNMKDFVSMVTNKTGKYTEFIAAIDERWKLGEEIIAMELDKFVNYWTEKTLDGKKELWQTKKTFEVQRRMITWFTNYFKGFKTVAKDFIPSF